MKDTREAIKAELEAIQQKNPENLLKVGDVVDFAKDPSTALHNQFQWDDNQAAHAYRLWQARQVIQKFWIVVEDNGSKVDVPVWVSIDNDRKTGGGYRTLEEVRVDPVMFDLCLDTALRELQPWRQRYESIKALGPVFKALDKVATRSKRKPAAKKATKTPRVGA